MENSTIIFILTLVVAFAFLRWLISPIPQSVAEELNLPNPQTTSENHNVSSRSGSLNRDITYSMVEIVQAIGPQLTEAQIRYSIGQTGSVEATVDQYMESGTLPYPPGYSVAEAHTEHPSSGGLAASSKSESLLDKYALDKEEDVDDQEIRSLDKWGKDRRERDDLLRKRKEKMILRARQRMKESLGNEIGADSLTSFKKDN